MRRRPSKPVSWQEAETEAYHSAVINSSPNAVKSIAVVEAFEQAVCEVSNAI